MSMELLMEENLFDDVFEVSPTEEKNEQDRKSTLVEETKERECETEIEELMDTDQICNVHEIDNDPDDSLLDTLLDTTKTFQSLDLGQERDNSMNSTISASKPDVPVRLIQTQDSMQKLRSEEDSRQSYKRQSRRSRRRRRSLKDSIASLFSSSSSPSSSRLEKKDPNSIGKSRNNRRTPSPRDPQRTKRTERSSGFFSSSAFLKRRTVTRRKKHGQRRFSALSLEFDLFHSSEKMKRRSLPIRQSSSTAFTSAAFEVSQVFDREQLEADRELDREETSDERSPPFGKQTVSCFAE